MLVFCNLKKQAQQLNLSEITVVSARKENF